MAKCRSLPGLLVPPSRGRADGRWEIRGPFPFPAHLGKRSRDGLESTEVGLGPDSYHARPFLTYLQEALKKAGLGPVLGLYTPCLSARLSGSVPARPHFWKREFEGVERGGRKEER